MTSDREARDTASAEGAEQPSTVCGKCRYLLLFPVRISPQQADVPNSNKVIFSISQGPGPSNNIFLKGNESVFNLALVGRCVSVQLPEDSLGCAHPGCGHLPLLECDQPPSMVQAPLLSSSSSGNPLSYLNYSSSLVSAKKSRDL